MRTAKFYKLMIRTDDLGETLAWHRKRKDAAKELSDWLADHPDDSGAITKVTIPLNTDGIIRWLNAHFQLDNG